MKIIDIHYLDYLKKSEEKSYHPKLLELYKKLPNKIESFKNSILYGPSGVGKYTQMLEIVKKYSPSKLKYEKKMSVIHNKVSYNYKISDIHFEIDMSLLGCNAKILWHEIYNNILDIIITRPNKEGIIVCKNFHNIHMELHDIFYTYMQNLSIEYIRFKSIHLKYIILTENIGFISNNIINTCILINIPKLTKTQYNSISNTNKNKQKQSKIKENINNEISKELDYEIIEKKTIEKNNIDKENIIKVEIDNINDINSINNIKNLEYNINHIVPYIYYCNELLEYIINIKNIKFSVIRDKLYDLFIYNLDTYECIWYILDYLISNNYLNDVNSVLIKTYYFLQYYNNNYRPIYHLENYIFYLINDIYGYKQSV